MLGGFTRSLSALVHFTLHTGAGVDSVVYKLFQYRLPINFTNRLAIYSLVSLGAYNWKSRYTTVRYEYSCTYRIPIDLGRTAVIDLVVRQELQIPYKPTRSIYL